MNATPKPAGALAPVQLVAGSEPLLVLEAADAIRAAARAQGYAEREVHDVGASFDWSAFEAGFSALSLFAQRRLVELRLPTGKPGKEGGAAISAFCDNPPPDTLLLIVAQEWSRQHEGAWSRAVEKVGRVQVFWPMKPGDLPGWLSNRLRRAGLTATPEALALLGERIEGNLLAAAQEIDKLALLAPGARLDLDTLERLVADSARFDVFGLAEAALSGDAQRALRVLAGLRAEGDQVPALLPWLASQLALVGELARADAARRPLDAIFQQNRVFGPRQAALKRTLRRAGPNLWEALLAEVGQLDALAKGRGQGDAWVRLERLLLGIAEPRRWAELAPCSA